MELKTEYVVPDAQAINDLLSKVPEIKSKEKILEPFGCKSIQDRFKTLKKDIDIINSDYISFDCKNKYDVIIAHFPYQESTSGIGYSQYMLKALQDVKKDGYVCSFQRLSQLESKKRYEKIYGIRPPSKVFIYCKRICGYRNGIQKESGSIAYTWTIWHKDMSGRFTEETRLGWIY